MSAMTCVLLAAAVGVMPTPGKLAVSLDHFVFRSPSSRKNEKIYVWYPTDLNKGPFGLASFMHGMTAGGPKTVTVYSELCETVAKLGFVVVAPETCPHAYCGNLYLDQLAAIEETFNVSNHKSFAHIDRKRGVGVFGHSMGGDATTYSAETKYGKKYNVTAAVAMHPVTEVSSSKQIDIPIMYTTGSSDHVVSPGAVTKAFKVTASPVKALANIHGAEHTEPCNGKRRRLNLYAAYYLDCYTGHKASCPAVDSLCGHQSWEYTECKNEH